MFGQYDLPDADDEDLDAFHEEAIPHLDPLYGTALKLTKDEQDAEDLVQETMLKAYRHFDKYENGTNCKAWLFKIMHNTFINRYRKDQKRKEYLVDDEEYRSLEERAEAPEQHPFVDDIDDEEELYFKMFTDQVKEALRGVPVKFRMVVLLADLQDFQYKEIAEIMDCPIGTVMSRLYRGRRMLREELGEYAEDEGYVSLEEEDEDDAEAADEGTEAEEKTTDLNEYREKQASG
ncbi:MAG: sigma-70 family RNA polymerase sigma factor [Bradymonadaceae bacterium]